VIRSLDRAGGARGPVGWPPRSVRDRDHGRYQTCGGVTPTALLRLDDNSGRIPVLRCMARRHCVPADHPPGILAGRSKALGEPMLPWCRGDDGLPDGLGDIFGRQTRSLWRCAEPTEHPRPIAAGPSGLSTVTLRDPAPRWGKRRRRSARQGRRVADLRLAEDRGGGGGVRSSNRDG